MNQRRWPKTLLLGAGVIIAAELLLFYDVAIVGRLNAPQSILEWAARLVRMNITPIAWCGFLLAIEGLLTAVAWRRGERGSCVRTRPWRFTVAYLTSIPVWCFFDWVNFYYLTAWDYVGMPPYWPDRYLGYFLAFGAISPAMFLCAEFYQQIGMRRWRRKGAGSDPRTVWKLLILCAVVTLGPLIAITVWRHHADSLAVELIRLTGVLIVPGVVAAIVTRRLTITALVMGVGYVAWPFIDRQPTACFTLWVGLILLLDPINGWLGRPSILRDLCAGRWGRSMSLVFGAATCGLLWEFWNYWAVTKWVYHLPFLGPLEQFKYFEMPLVGFSGFLPFGIECWVALQTILILLPGIVEPLPSEDHVM